MNIDNDQGISPVQIRLIEETITRPGPEALISATNDIEAIAVWLNEYKHSKNTLESYRLAAERYYTWLTLRHKSLARASREDVQHYQEFLLDPQPSEYWCGKKCQRDSPDWKPFVKGLGVSSVKLQFQILNMLYNYLIDAGYLSQNPIRLMRVKIKATKQLFERFLTLKEKEYILDYIYALPASKAHEEGYKEQVLWIFSLLYLTACRRDEVTRAKMGDFIHRRGQWWLKVVGKGDKAGEIPATQGLMLALQRYRKFLELDPDTPKFKEETPLIVGQRGHLQPISNTRLNQVIKKLCFDVAASVESQDMAAAYNLRRVSPHWFRHTSATHQVDAGIDIRIVKENLRHSSLETTMKYQHSESDNRYNQTDDKFKL